MPVSLRRTPDGRRLVVDRPVNAPAARVWDLLRDTDRWPEWGPSVAAVDCPTRYVEAGTEGRVRVARVPATGHRVVPTDDGRCRAAIEVLPLAVAYVPAAGGDCHDSPRWPRASRRERVGEDEPRFSARRRGRKGRAERPVPGRRRLDPFTVGYCTLYRWLP